MLPCHVAVTVALTTGDTDFTSGAWVGSWRACTSEAVSSERWLWVPVPARPPAPRVKPFMMVMVLVPRLSIRFWTALDDPLPTATSTITAPTPIMMPSMVSDERSLLAMIPRRAMVKLSPPITPGLRRGGPAPAGAAVPPAPPGGGPR